MYREILNIVKGIVNNRMNRISYPSFCTFIVTWKCNARCVMCNIWKKQKYEEMDLGQIDTVFNQLKSLDVVRITGGEPFVRSDLVEIVNIIQQVVLPEMIHITSNGFLTEKIVNFIKRVDNPKNIHIKISIDAIGKKHDNIRGISGAYEKAIKTVEKLAALKNEFGFYLGIDQTIVDTASFDDAYILRKTCRKLGIDLHQVIAYENDVALYGLEDNVASMPPLGQFQTYGKFSKEEVERNLSFMNETANGIDNFREKVVKRYYLMGLYNRLLLNKPKPNPKCVALQNHIRILPNADIAVCLYDSRVIGNLVREKFTKIWFGNDIKKYRDAVKKCPGCWASCEVIPNAIYTGDIIKAIMFKHGNTKKQQEQKGVKAI